MSDDTMTTPAVPAEPWVLRRREGWHYRRNPEGGGRIMRAKRYYLLEYTTATGGRLTRSTRAGKKTSRTYRHGYISLLSLLETGYEVVSPTWFKVDKGF